ncbi:MAG: cell division protein FtsA [Candidatus Kapaibacterium sp.]
MSTSNSSINRSQSGITVGLDVGTTKICALVAEPGEKPDTLNILGIGIAPSEGLNRGVVTNIDKTVRAINDVIQQAEQQSGKRIKDVVVGIAGDHIDSIQARGIIGISNSNMEIARSDVQRLLEDTRKINISPDREIIHLIPQDFIIDGQDRIIDPVGMSGVRMEANVHVVTGLRSAIKNMHRCVERCGLVVKDIVLEPLASSTAILSEEEKEVGVALIDIGGGTTDIAIFEENIIRYSSVFAIAGNQVTDDIRKGLGIIASQAEEIKRAYGHAYEGSIMKDEVFMIPGIGGRKPMEATKSYLCQIIQPRMEELFEFALSEIIKSGFAGSLGAGVVLTGGTTLLRGTEELAQEIFGMPVKIGIPRGISYSGLAPEIESPIYSTSVGLALYALRQEEEAPQMAEEPVQPESQSVAPEVETEEIPKKGEKVTIFNRVKKFIEEL